MCQQFLLERVYAADNVRNPVPRPEPQPTLVPPILPTPELPDDDDNITLYHYTLASRGAQVLSSGILYASLEENGDAEYGPGQYFTDLTPSESSTVTRRQHAYTLYSIPMKWGTTGTLQDVM